MKVLPLIAIAFFILMMNLSRDGLVTVNLNKTYQTIKANGINFEGYHRHGGDELVDLPFERMLKRVKTELLRVGIPLKAWEPVNDNSDALSFEWKGFIDKGRVRKSFRRLKKLKDRNYSLWLSLWDAPNWMVKNPKENNQRSLNDIDEFIEAVSAYLYWAKNHYGVTPKIVKRY